MKCDFDCKNEEKKPETKTVIILDDVYKNLGEAIGRNRTWGDYTQAAHIEEALRIIEYYIPHYIVTGGEFIPANNQIIEV